MFWNPVWKIIKLLKEALSFYFDLRDTLQLIGGGAMTYATIAYLNNIPLVVQFALLALGLGLLASAVIHPIYRYSKWNKTKDKRIICLDIPVILQKMHKHLATISKGIFEKPLNEEQFNESLYQFGYYVFNRPEMLKKALRKKPKVKDLREFVSVLATFFDKNSELKNVIDHDEFYNQLDNQLIEASKVIDKQELNDNITDIKQFLYEICFAQLYRRQFIGKENKHQQAVFNVQERSLEQIISKMIFEVKRKIMRYWLWEA